MYYMHAPLWYRLAEYFSKIQIKFLYFYTSVLPFHPGSLHAIRIILT